MSKDRTSSWKHLSSSGSRLSSLKTYVSGELPLRTRSLPTSQREPSNGEPSKQSWRDWAGQKIRNRQNLSGASMEVVEMFPGWAVRRYVQQENSRLQVPAPFGVEIFVSGLVSTRRNPENPTRSQRAFARLAKSFAGLPRNMDNLTQAVSSESTLSQLIQTTDGDGSVDQPLLSPESTNDTSAIEQEYLRAQERILGDNDILKESPPSSSTDELSLYQEDEVRKTVEEQQQIPVDDNPSTPQAILRRRYDNLETRIRQLWYSALPNRTVRLHLLVAQHNSSDHDGSNPEEVLLNPENGHLSSQDVTTAADGSFHARFDVKWDVLCCHPRALHIAFGEMVEDHDLLIVAQLVPHSKIFQPNSLLHLPAQSHSIPLIPSPLTACIRTPITHSPIRVISDIDDTVKRTGVTSGARTIFSNVFVNDFKDNVISGMSEWYMRMFSRGVRFHYVSNGPFSLLSLLNEFFRISQLPPGSLKLRSYSGRSLFEGLVSAPATRKRGGVLEVLNSFPDSKFILIGDTGEQDLELYAEIARDRPHQIVGAFLRDADADDRDIDSIADPTGSRALDTDPDDSPFVFPSPSTTSSGSFSSIFSRFPSYKSQDSDRSSSLPTSDTSGQVDVEIAGKSTINAVPTLFDPAGSNLRDKGSGKARSRGAYFGLGPLTSQPEEVILEPQSDPNFKALGVQHSRQIIGSPSINRPNLVKSASQPTPSISRSNQSFISEPPKPISPPSITNPRPHSPSLVSDLRQDSDTFSFGASDYGFENERKQTSNVRRRRTELQMRVYKARAQMPKHIALRVFREPIECVEVDKFLV